MYERHAKMSGSLRNDADNLRHRYKEREAFLSKHKSKLMMNISNFINLKKKTFYN